MGTARGPECCSGSAAFQHHPGCFTSPAAWAPPPERLIQLVLSAAEQGDRKLPRRLAYHAHTGRRASTWHGVARKQRRLGPRAGRGLCQHLHPQPPLRGRCCTLPALDLGTPGSQHWLPGPQFGGPGSHTPAFLWVSLTSASSVCPLTSHSLFNTQSRDGGWGRTDGLCHCPEFGATSGLRGFPKSLEFLLMRGSRLQTPRGQGPCSCVFCSE